MTRSSDRRAVGAAEALGVFALLLSLSVLTRWSSLSREVIDWDESTMILLGAGLAQGALPFVELWDLKPPVTFFALGGAFALFGESLAVARGLGAACVAAGALGVHLIARRRLGPGRALALAAAMAAAASIRPMQPVMTAQVSLAFLGPGVWLLLAGRRRPGMLAAAGVLMGLAALTRTNLALPAVAGGLLLIWGGAFARSPGVHRRGWLAYLAGGLAPNLAFLGLYAAAGELRLYLDTLIRVPLLYAAGGAPLPAGLALLVGGWGNMALHFPLRWGGATALALWGAAVAWRGRRTAGSGAVWLAVLAGATALGMAANGAVVWHHALVLLPFALLAAVPAMERGGWAAAALAIEAPASVARLVGAPQEGALQALAGRIAADAGPGDRLFALEYHLLCWHLGQRSPTPVAAHPSALVRPAIQEGVVATGIARPDEFREILAARPRYLALGRLPPWYLEGRPEGALLLRVLVADYLRWDEGGGAVVYRRR